MPPVFATAQMIAFVEWACVHALSAYLSPDQRTVGTRVEMTHSAATPIGMMVTAEVELVEIDGRRFRFHARCRDEVETIGEGFHERTVIDHPRFMERLAQAARLGAARLRITRSSAGARQRDAEPDIRRYAEQNRRGPYQDPFHGRCSLVRFCVALEKNHWGQSPFRDSPTRLVTLRNGLPPGSKKGPPVPPPSFVVGESGDRDL